MADAERRKAREGAMPEPAKAQKIAGGLTAAAENALLMAGVSGICHRQSRMHDWMLHSLPAGLAVDHGDQDSFADWVLTPLGRQVLAETREGGRG